MRAMEMEAATLPQTHPHPRLLMAAKTIHTTADL